MGTFIRVEIDNAKLTQLAAEKMPPLCPVDIFLLNDGALGVRVEQEDECTLCELCLDAAPVGAVTIHKKYKDERLVSRGRAE